MGMESAIISGRLCGLGFRPISSGSLAIAEVIVMALPNFVLSILSSFTISSFYIHPSTLHFTETSNSQLTGIKCSVAKEKLRY